MSQKPLTFLLEGGLDQVTPRIAVPKGRILGAQNHECGERGVRRIDGYERYDGRLRPSEATYHYAPFTSGNTSLTQGTAVAGSVSGATATVVDTATLLSGSYGASNGVGYVGLYVTSGTFQSGEGLQVAAVTKVTLSAAPTERGAPNDTINATLLHAEMERRRALIQKPAGSGPVRGVWMYSGVLYAFRDNVPASLTEMWVASTGGWLNIVKGERVSFNLGLTEFLEGETLTQGGVTATIVRVVVRSGDWSTNDAAGYVSITARSGGNFAAGAATSSSGSATLLAAQGANLLAGGGRYHFRTHSFSGSANDERMYGVSGVASAFEFDGTNFVSILPLGIVERPTHIAVQANHLLLGYDAGNVLISEIGYPLAFKAINDAAEINFGSPMTGMLDGTATASMWFARERIAYLVGSDADTWNLQDVTTTSGARPETPVMAGPLPFYMDDGGIQKLTAGQSFGDWTMGSVSALVAPLIKAKSDAGVQPTCALSIKRKTQVRFFFDDGSGISVYLGRKYPEITPFTLPIVVYCGVVGKDADGNEVVYVGAEDGYVYQLEAGTSFDGAAVDAWVLFHFVSPFTTEIDCRWHTATFGIDGPSSVTLTIVADYDFGDPSLQSSATSSMIGGGNFWDVDGQWDDFVVWDAPVQGEVWADLAGYGFNCAVAVSSSLTYEQPYTLGSLSLAYSLRKLRRK